MTGAFLNNAHVNSWIPSTRLVSFSLKDFPIAEPLLARVNAKQGRPTDYQKAWSAYANDRADSLHIKEKDKKFRPRKICLLGCCIHAPRADYAVKLVNMARSLVFNLVRQAQKVQQETKGRL